MVSVSTITTTTEPAIPLSPPPAPDTALAEKLCSEFIAELSIKASSTKPSVESVTPFPMLASLMMSGTRIETATPALVSPDSVVTPSAMLFAS